MWPGKPEPESILGGCMGLLMVGCVSLSQNQRDKKESYLHGLEKARKVSYLDHCPKCVEDISAKIKMIKGKP